MRLQEFGGLRNTLGVVPRAFEKLQKPALISGRHQIGRSSVILKGGEENLLFVAELINVPTAMRDV